MNKVEQVKNNIIKCNNEVFIRSTYNTINIIIRKKDKFVNATQMCNQFNRRFRKIYENHAWQEYYEEFKQEYYNKRLGPEMGQVPKYEIKKGYLKELRGMYVDPRLINYIAMWACPKYAIYVGKIMDSINERAKLKNISDNENLNEIINKLNEENKELRDKITEQEKTIEEQEETIIEQEETIEEQANKLFDKSVRVNINNRKLTIHQEDGLIKISVNNSRKFKDIIAQYNFPASMNVKMSIKKEFKIKNLNNVPEEKLNDIINYLKGLQPKDI